MKWRFNQVFAADDSAPMQSCVLTATMGNYARLRHLQLADRVVEASDVFRSDKIGGWDFYPAHQWPASELIHDHGKIKISVTGDTDTTPPPDGWKGWRYSGVQAEQSWSTDERPGVGSPGIVARVNGREMFWGTHVAIPGGVAFENVELVAPFENKQIFTFRVTPRKDQE